MPKNTRMSRLTRLGTAVPSEWDLSDLLRHPAQDSELILKQLDQQVSEVESKRAALSADIRAFIRGGA